MIKLTIIYPTDAYSEKIGGIETFIRNKIAFMPEGFECDIVGISTRAKRLRVGQWHDVVIGGKKIRFFPAMEDALPNKRTLVPVTLRFFLALLAMRRRIDLTGRIVEYHRFDQAPAFAGLGIPNILFQHGNTEFLANRYCESRWKHLSALYVALEKAILKKSLKVFVISSSGAERLRKEYPGLADKIEFVPCSYDPAIFRIHERSKAVDVLAKYGIKRSGPILLFVGRLETAKDPVLLIESFREVCARISGAALVIAGFGGLEVMLKKYVASLGLTGKVHFLGSRTQEEVALLMNAADILLITSAFEGLPTVAVESLACGLPVVSTDIGDVGQAVQDKITGRLVRSRAPAAIAQEVGFLLAELPDKDKCAAAAAKFSVGHVMGRIYGEIGKACKERQIC